MSIIFDALKKLESNRSRASDTVRTNEPALVAGVVTAAAGKPSRNVRLPLLYCAVVVASISLSSWGYSFIAGRVSGPSGAHGDNKIATAASGVVSIPSGEPSVMENMNSPVPATHSASGGTPAAKIEGMGTPTGIVLNLSLIHI